MSSVFVANAQSKENVDNHLVETINGELFYGNMLIESDSIIVLKTSFGEIKFLKTKVQKITTSNNGFKGIKFNNPNPTHYFFGPSAISLKRKTGYYQNVLLSSNFANYGLTDNISIGGGFELISTINGSPLWFFTPKTGYKLRDKMYVGGGIFLIGVGFDDNIASLAYGLFTYGNKNSNITVATGYGFIGGEKTTFAPIMVNCTYRINNVISLLSENYIFSDLNANINYLGIQGFRVLSKANVFDIGLVISPSLLNGFVPALPFVGYAKRF